MSTRKLIYIAGLLATLPLVACGEKPQTLAQTEEHAESRSQTPLKDSQRQRTLNEGEGNRNDNDGVLR